MEYNLFLTGCGHAYWYGVPPCQIPLFCIACIDPMYMLAPKGEDS